MKKDDVQFHLEGFGRRARPAVNVKVYRLPVKVEDVQKRFGCDEDTAEKALQFAFDSRQQMFWEDVQGIAEDCLGKGVKVYSEGRSGGWLVVEGLPAFDSWDAVQLGKWASFTASVAEVIKGYTDKEMLLDDIEANRWAEPGAEAYNFKDTEAGTICIVDEKRIGDAAPELLKALEDIIEHRKRAGVSISDHVYLNAVEAIAKAKGGK